MVVKNIAQYIESIIEAKGNESIYIIKGIEFKSNILKYDKVFEEEFISDYLKGKVSLNDVIINIANLSNNRPIILLYSEMIALKELNVFGLIDQHEKKQFLIDINIFDQTYSTFIDVKDKREYYKLYENNVDNNFQKIFSYYTTDLNHVLYEYQNINHTFDDRFFWQVTEYISDFNYVHEKDVDVDYILNSNSNKYDLISLASELFEKRKNINFLINDNSINFSTLKYILGSAKQINLEIYEINQINRSIETKVEYDFTSILKRIHPKFEFKQIPVYENPGINKNLINISQEVIINEIYSNAISASNEERFNDIFVTASTGAGKSVMFQIPAIKLVEELELITIVITPLIGLMNDQINNIKRMTTQGVTINSEYTPHEKDKIKEDIISGEKSIIYLSPETLLSNYDLSSIIGTRKIGLMVIDEAHTVATWGKSFRPDYWYLGDYLRRIRKTKVHGNFPIVALTATATFGGFDDMYFDILDSLFMNVSKPYIGKVTRDNIEFVIKNKKKINDYKKEKHDLTNKRIKTFLENDEKTLVYFPYVKTIREIYKDVWPLDKKYVGRYMGSLDKLEKDGTLEQFRDGDMKIVLATKAFGMGIDIDDIKNVYHFAPTGNLADYVQEIGRAGRDQSIKGKAITDFYEEDFRYIKQLFGISSIKQYEVVGVIQKILDIYEKQNKRNFLVSPEEFSHVFNNATVDEIDSRLKTTLLIVKKDLENMGVGFSLIFKPRSMFTKGLFLINDQDIPYFEKCNWMRYLSVFEKKEDLKHQTGNMTTSYLGDVYELDFKKMWEERYQDYSFGHFKKNFFEDKLPSISLDNKLKSKILVHLKTKNNLTFNQMLDKYREFMHVFEKILNEYRSDARHIRVDEFSYRLNELWPNFKNSTQAELVTNSVLYLINKFDQGKSFGRSHFLRFNSETEKYEITSSIYKQKISQLIITGMRSLREMGERTERIFLENNIRVGGEIKDNMIIIMAQILELIDIAEYSIKSGDSPEFFIRVNSESVLRRFLDPYYQSDTLSKVKRRHDYSISIMEYFFTKLETNNERWSLIEEYFLGEDLIKKVEEFEL